MCAVKLGPVVQARAVGPEKDGTDDLRQSSRPRPPLCPHRNHKHICPDPKNTHKKKHSLLVGSGRNSKLSSLSFSRGHTNSAHVHPTHSTLTDDRINIAFFDVNLLVCFSKTVPCRRRRGYRSHVIVRTTYRTHYGRFAKEP